MTSQGLTWHGYKQVARLLNGYITLVCLFFSVSFLYFQTSPRVDIWRKEALVGVKAI